MSAHSSKTAIVAALFGNLAVAATKFVAAVWTGSSAMMSEGVHSLVDTTNQVFLLIGMKKAEKPPSDLHPFGHGKEVYFWSFVVAIMVFALGAGISLYEGIHGVMAPEPTKDVYINYIVLGLSILMEGASWYVALKIFLKQKGEKGFGEAISVSKDPAVVVVFLEDSAAMLGLVVALVGIFLADRLDMPALDGWASIAIAAILGLTAVVLAIETKSLLIGEAASPELIRSVNAIVGRDPRITNVNEVLSMHLGPQDILLNISVDFEDGLSASQIEKAAEDLDRTIRGKHPEVGRIFVEAESMSQARIRGRR